jgi:hypothetical protein
MQYLKFTSKVGGGKKYVSGIKVIDSPKASLKV